MWLEVPVRGLVVCVNQSDWEIPAKEHAGMTNGVHAGMTEGVHAGITVVFSEGGRFCWLR
mgnify:CR=1 FL=1